MKKIIITIMAIAMAVAGAITVLADAPDDYEAYFSFDETLEDASGNYTAELIGVTLGESISTTANYVNGMVNKALAVNSDGNMDGFKTGVNLADTSYTISFIAQADSYESSTPIVWIGRTDQTTENWHGFWSGFGTGWDDRIAGLGSNDSSGARVGIASELYLNAATANSFFWTVITWTFDADTQTATLYYDDIEVGSCEGMPVLEDDAIVYIGANYWDTPCVFLIDELYIYTRVLTDTEIARVMSVSGCMSEEEIESLDAYVSESESIAESERVSEIASSLAAGDGENDVSSSTGENASGSNNNGDSDSETSVVDESDSNLDESDTDDETTTAKSNDDAEEEDNSSSNDEDGGSGIIVIEVVVIAVIVVAGIGIVTVVVSSRKKRG